MLAVLPALGPVTVQARKTMVSLVSPRRTFAVVQATTKDRVDLGLRLDDDGPAAACCGQDIGAAATVRIPLTGPRTSTRRPSAGCGAPTTRTRRRPRRAARPGGRLPWRDDHRGDRGLRPARAHLPAGAGRRGHDNVHVALGGKSEDRPALAISNKPGMAIEPVPGDASAARWEMPVTVRRDEDGFDFAGPFVRGARDDRHLGLIWGDLQGDGTLRVFRGAKLRLVDVDPGLIEQALRPGHRLVARIRLTDPGGIRSAPAFHPPYLTWSAAADGAS